MSLVGEKLKASRESQNIKIAEVVKELNIPAVLLKKIEKNDFESEIDNVFLIGHIRSYSSFLSLDENQIIEQFKKETLTQKPKKIEIEKPKFNYRLFYSNKLLSLSLILFIFGAFYFLFIENENLPREYAIIPDLPENYIATVEKVNLDNEILNNQINNDSEQNYAKFEINQNSSSAIASVNSNEDKVMNTITLKFLDDAWLQIRDNNNEIIISQLMNKNELYSYGLSSNYSITSGNAGHILVLIDEKVRGKLGNKGQVVDSFIINQDFNN